MGTLATRINPFLLVLSMEWASLLGKSIGTQQILQYPDARLYKAATLLKPEDRPTIPVRLYDDPDKAYAPLGRKGNPRARAFTMPDRSAIHVYRKNPDFNYPHRLAAILAHEQAHVANGPDEGQAYQKESQVAEEFGPKISKEHRRALKWLAGSWSKK